MPKLTRDLANQLTADEIETRTTAIGDRVRERFARATEERRDLTQREAELTEADRRDLGVLAEVTEQRAAVEVPVPGIDAALAAIDRLAAERENRAATAPFRPSLLVADEHLAQHAEAMAGGRPFGAVEVRARVTAGSDLGSAGAWHPGAPAEPRHLIAFAGVPISPLEGKTAQIPAYGNPAAAGGADEGADHNEYDAVDPITLSALRFGRWTEVSSVANQLDDLRGINSMHSWAIARDLDAVAVTAIQAAAGTAAVLTDLERQVRAAILAIAANTYADPSRLVVFGRPDAVAALTGTTPANGDDVGSVSVRFSGARVYPTNAAAVTRLVVFNPASFRAFQSPLQSASLIDPQSGANKFGSWIHSTSLGQQIPGSALAVATVATP